MISRVFEYLREAGFGLLPIFLGAGISVSLVFISYVSYFSNSLMFVADQTAVRNFFFSFFSSVAISIGAANILFVLIVQAMPVNIILVGLLLYKIIRTYAGNKLNNLCFFIIQLCRAISKMRFRVASYKQLLVYLGSILLFSFLYLGWRNGVIFLLFLLMFTIAFVFSSDFDAQRARIKMYNRLRPNIRGNFIPSALHKRILSVFISDYVETFRLGNAKYILSNIMLLLIISSYMTGLLRANYVLEKDDFEIISGLNTKTNVSIVLKMDEGIVVSDKENNILRLLSWSGESLFSTKLRTRD